MLLIFNGSKKTRWEGNTALGLLIAMMIMFIAFKLVYHNLLITHSFYFSVKHNNTTEIKIDLNRAIEQSTLIIPMHNDESS